MSTSEEMASSGQAEVFHEPQPGYPRDRESSLEIPRLETGRTPGGKFQRRDRRLTTTPTPGPTNQESRLAGSRREEDGPTSTGVGDVSRPTLARPESATCWPCSARQGTIAASWTLRALQSATPTGPATGAPMPTPWTWHMWRRKPNGCSTTPTRQFSGMKHADVGFDADVEQVMTAKREASLVVEKAHQVLV